MRELAAQDGALLLQVRIMAYHLVAPEQRLALPVGGDGLAVLAHLEGAGRTVGEQVAVVGRRLGDGVGPVGQRVGSGLCGVGPLLGVPRGLDDGDHRALGAVGALHHDSVLRCVHHRELDAGKGAAEVARVPDGGVVGAPDSLALPELKVVLLHLHAAALHLVEHAVGLYQLVELAVLADLDHVADDALPGVAVGGLRLNDLVGAEGKRADPGRGRPCVQRLVVLGGDGHDGVARAEELGLLERAVAVRVVPDGVGGAVVHRELRPLEGGVALGVAPELAVLVLVALGVALAHDEAAALGVLPELACGLDLDDLFVALGHVGRHAQAVGLAVEQVAARRVELAHLDVAEGDVLEHDERASRLALDGLGRAAALVARLVERPAEGGVALRRPPAGLGVELPQLERHRDGRLGRGERVVVGGPHLVDARVERVARGGLHLLGVEGVARGPEAARLARAARVGREGGDAVAVGLGVSGRAVDAVDCAGQRVVGVACGPRLGGGLRHLHGGVVGEREDDLGGGAGVEHEGLEVAGHLARARRDLAARGVGVDLGAVGPEACHVPAHPLAESLRAPEQGVVAVGRVSVGHQDVCEGHVAVGRHGPAPVPAARPEPLVEAGRAVGEPDVRRQLAGAPADGLKGLLGIGAGVGRALRGVAAPCGLAVHLEPGGVVGVVFDARTDREGRPLGGLRLGGRERERGQKRAQGERRREQDPHGLRGRAVACCFHAWPPIGSHGLKGARRPSPWSRRPPWQRPPARRAPGRPWRALRRSACGPRRGLP